MLKDLQGILSLVRPYALGALSKAGRFTMGSPTSLAFSLLPSYLRAIPSDTPASLASRHAHGQIMRNAIMSAVNAEPGANVPGAPTVSANPMADYIRKQNAAAGVPTPAQTAQQPALQANASAPVPLPQARPVSADTSVPLPQARPLSAGDNTYNYGGVQVPVFGSPTPSPFSGAGFGADEGYFGSPSNMGQGSTNNLDLMKLILGKF